MGKSLSKRRGEKKIYPLQTLPADLVWAILDYAPEQAIKLGRTCRWLRSRVDEYALLPGTTPLMDYLALIGSGSWDTKKPFMPCIDVVAVIDPSLTGLFELRLKLLHFSRVDVAKQKVRRGDKNKLTQYEFVINDRDSRERLSCCLDLNMQSVYVCKCWHCDEVEFAFQFLADAQARKVDVSFVIFCFEDYHAAILLKFAKTQFIDHIGINLNDSKLSIDPVQFLLELSSHVQSLHLSQYSTLNDNHFKNYFFGAHNVDWAPVFVEMFSRKMSMLRIINNSYVEYLSTKGAALLRECLPYIGKNVSLNVTCQKHPTDLSYTMNDHSITVKNGYPSDNCCLKIVHQSRENEPNMFWFSERLADFYNMKTEREYGAWKYLGNIGGYAEKYSYRNVTVEVVTVKGAGHFCALDRPGPTLQVFSSFLRNQPLDSKVPADLELAPLKDKFVIEETVGRQKDLAADATKIRAKRATKDALPPPPPACKKTSDKIDVLPGLTFDFPGNHYSGYLNAGSGSYLHYWLVEADKDPATAPLILWLNGGPGCSSLSGLLKAMGPYLNNLDGETLYENIFSWHKVANILYIESPKDVGFSYQASDSDPNTANHYSDDLTAEDNVRALVDFLNCYPEYKNRKLFITGESYAGIYVPTFVDLLLKKIINKEVTDVNLEGFAIGNGYFSGILGINSAISLTYFRGMHSKKEYESLSRCVPNDNVGPMVYFDWSQYIEIDIRGQPQPRNPDPSTKDGFCGAEIIRQAWNDVWNTENDVYNTYQDCYERHPLPAPGDQDASSNIEFMKRAKRDTIGRPMNYLPFIDGAKRLNYQSSDNNGGLQCVNPKEPYLNRPEVRKAIHIPDTFTKKWQVCSDTMEDYDYDQQYNDTTPFFQRIFSSAEKLNKPLRVLFYHGDADMACQFLEGQWFLDNLAKKTQMTLKSQFAPWIYEQMEGSALKNPGGYMKSYKYKDLVTLDHVTIKGAGHMVPVDRPGPMLQAINNYITNIDYNTPLWKSLSIARKPLNAEFIGAPDSITSRKDADRIYELPGLTYDPTFKQWSGYLQASKGNKLFYWFVESQNTDPSLYTPVVLWLNGGPGCSSLIGMMQENGPFRVNPDQRTLWENVYSWNKAAHVLYIDSPRRVGFSYQNMTENDDEKWDDDKTASDAYTAIEDFFTIFPEMKLKDFYTSGESYCGVYVPLITSYLVNKINAGESHIKLAGMMIGNGEMSFVQDLRSTPSFAYYHGMVGKTEYDSLADCCPGDDVVGGLYCHYDDYINPLGWQPRTGLSPEDQKCADKVRKLLDGPPGYEDVNDQYNLYQDCYALPVGDATETRSKMKERVMMRRRHPSRRFAAQSQQAQSPAIAFNDFNPVSTDNNGGFYCYMDDATENYLNQPHVRSAIHVPEHVQPWTSCASIHYQKLYEDMGATFENIFTYNSDFKILIYNGDVDFVCHHLQAEWFIEQLTHKNAFKHLTEKREWRHRGVIGGYVSNFNKAAPKNINIDLVTVKGAGHYVPMDRPGPALQMVSNFLRNVDYSKPVPYSLDRKPLLPQYTRKGVPSDNASSSPKPTPVPTTPATRPPPPTASPSTSVPTTTTTKTPAPTTTSGASLTTSISSLVFALLALMIFH